MSGLLTLDEYLKLTKKERIELYEQKAEEEDQILREEMMNEQKHAPDHLKEQHAPKKVIRLCWWLADPALHDFSHLDHKYDPGRCPYLDRELYRCTNFKDGWIECEDVALRIKRNKLQNDKH